MFPVHFLVLMYLLNKKRTASPEESSGFQLALPAWGVIHAGVLF